MKPEHKIQKEHLSPTLRFLKNPPALVMAMAGFLLAAFILFSQPENSGFSRGHHGWVSAHAMAISEHVEPENGFLGYANVSIQEDGRLEYHYFDRFPVWQAALTRLLTSTQDTFAQKVMLSRGLMNVLFIFTLFAAYSLLQKLFDNRLLAASASLLAMSSYYIAEYRDMIQYDMAPLLGILLIAHVILHAERHKRLGIRALLIVFAVSLGSGMAVVPMLFAWATLDLFRSAGTAHTIGHKALQWARSPSLKAFLISGTLVAFYLAYNVSFEAKIRSAPISETSIVDSAARRLGLVKDFSEKPRPVSLSWEAYAKTQLHRTSTAVLPYPPLGNADFNRAVPYYTERLGPVFQASLILFLIAAIFLITRKLPSPARVTLTLLAASGFLWLTPMKNLAIPHEYTTIYHLGALLAFYSGVVYWIGSRLPRGYQLMACLTPLLFLATVHSANKAHTAKEAQEGAYTRDLQMIASLIPPRATIHIAPPWEINIDDTPDVIPGVPYATAFYFSRQRINLSSASEYIVTRDKSYSEGNPCAAPLTPENSVVFAYRNAECSNSKSITDTTSQK